MVTNILVRYLQKCMSLAIHVFYVNEVPGLYWVNSGPRNLNILQVEYSKFCANKADGQLNLFFQRGTEQAC